MPYYHVPGRQDAVSSAYKTSAQVSASAAPTKRGKVTEINIGTLGNPNATDTYLQWDVSRITATGAGANTAWTPTSVDPADGAAQTSAGINATVEATTITSNSTIKFWGVNQRNTLRWVAQQESQMLIWPATSGSGLILRCLSATYTATSAGTIDFME